MAENVVKAMTELYQTMALMSANQRFSIRLAPAEGHILPTDVAAHLELRKSASAIELIRSMPYIEGYETEILPWSEVINYLREGSDAPHMPSAWRPIPYLEYGMADPLGDSIVEPREFDDEVGAILVIDTETYLARLWEHRDIRNQGDCTVHAGGGSNCPFLCVNRCGKLPEQRPAVEFFVEWKQKYLDLTWMLINCRGDIVEGDSSSMMRSLPEQRPAVEFFVEWKQKYLDLTWMLINCRGDIVEGDEDEEWFQIFHDHGWPNEFRSEACQLALDDAPWPGDDLNSYSDSSDEGGDDGDARM
nr:hypothetical protein CFP56_34864 [Quercus suber]